MEITIKKSKVYHKGLPSKCIVAGVVVGKSRGYEVQEHMETIYYFWYWRVIVKHDFKFIKY